MKTIYLAGMMDFDIKETALWREKAWLALGDAFRVLNPYRGKTSASSDFSAAGITLRDYRDIMAADIVLAHLGAFGSAKGPLGTICELAWAWEKKIPVIAITDTAPDHITEHPFVQTFVTQSFKSSDEAIAFIRRYFA